jgi:hypothetical protein
VDPLLTAVNSIHPVDEHPLASGIDSVFELVHVSLGLLLLDGFPRAFVWFSAGHVSRANVYDIWKVFHGFWFGFPAGHVSRATVYVIWKVFRGFLFGFPAGHVSRATVYVIWKVFRGFLFGFPAGHVSWGCLPVIWMVFRWLFYFVYLFIVVWISSRGFPYPTCISYLFRINLILLLSNGLCITTSGL